MHAAERDFRRGDEAQVAVLDAVNLRLRPARDEADALQHLDTGHVWCDHRHVALIGQRAHRVLHKGQFQQGGLALQEVELRPGDARAGLEIDQVQRLGQGDMVLRGEVELRRLAPGTNRQVVIADGRVGVGHVGDSQQGGPQVGLDLFLLLLQPGDLAL